MNAQEKMNDVRMHVCYTTAYKVLPRYIKEDPDHIIDGFAKDPDSAAKVYYLISCRLEQFEPDNTDLNSIKGIRKELEGEQICYLVRYPHFPKVDIFEIQHSGAKDIISRYVLSPYFSAVVTKGRKITYYFILGQSLGGGTTFRQITPDFNANLGEGCEPKADAFVRLVENQILPGRSRRSPIAGIVS